jgi:hypothetical protein
MAGPSTSASAAAHAQGSSGVQGQATAAAAAAAAAAGGATSSSTSSSSKLAAYEVLEVIGQGSFGKVCRVRRIADNKVRQAGPVGRDGVCACVVWCVVWVGASFLLFMP